MIVDDGFAAAIRATAALAASKGPEWGLVTHEDPFGARFVHIANFGPTWEKHGIDARGECGACKTRQLNIEVFGRTELAEGEATMCLTRPLTEAENYGLEP